MTLPLLLDKTQALPLNAGWAGPGGAMQRTGLRWNGLICLRRRTHRMYKRLQKLVLAGCIMGTCVAQGCLFSDPDVGLRASLSFGSDVAIFLLENLTAGL